MKKRVIWIVILIIIILAGLLLYYYQSHPSISLTDTAQHGIKKERKISYWVAPMDPNYRRDKPGKSPMGMDLVPVYADENSQSGIIISPAVINNLGVRTATVEKRTLPRIIDTVGYVTSNEDYIEHVHIYTTGWIRKLLVKKTGDTVKKGQLLAEIYSPTLINAQEEYLLALKYKSTALINAGLKKLLTLGVSRQQISRLKKTKKIDDLAQLYANQSGIVSALNIREGMFVTPESNLMTIEDLSSIWIVAEVFERQANWVSAGQSAIATFSYVPDKTWQGKVDYVYPQLDAKTHTLPVRLIFPNPDFTLKPKMYASVKIFAKPIRDVIAIPKEALIKTGEGDRVILSIGDGKFRARAVSTGIESGNWVAILSGLKAGDIVVTSAQFLIDSESNLKASTTRLDNTTEKNTNDTNIQTATQEWVGMGSIQAIDSKKREIILDHKPIPAIQMPAMRMGFYVVPSIDLSQFKKGDDIHFVLIKNGSTKYQITNIQKVKKNDAHHH